MSKSDAKFQTITLSRKDLMEALNALPDAGLVTLGIDSSLDGDFLMWASNSKYGDKRQVVFVNKELKKKNS